MLVGIGIVAVSTSTITSIGALVVACGALAVAVWSAMEARRANDHSANAVEIAGQALKVEQGRDDERRRQDEEQRRVRALKLDMAKGHGAMVSWGSGETVGGEPLLRLKNTADVPFVDIETRILRPGDEDAVDHLGTLRAGKQHSVELPSGDVEVLVTFTDVDGWRWQRRPLDEVAGIELVSRC